jgi:hypothetical protein
LRRKAKGRARLTNNDRWFFVQLYRWFPSILDVVGIIQPKTLMRWHRTGFRRYWRWKSGRQIGRPQVQTELLALIRQMSVENPLWGAPNRSNIRSAENVELSGCQLEMTAKSHHHDGNHYWSQKVTRDSNALELEAGVFTLDDPREIAHSLKHSAESSERRKSSPFRSAMSMLTFFINRAGSGLTEERRRVLEAAKVELRKEFGKPTSK